MIGFLVLPGPDDATARTLFERVRTLAFKRVVACDRARLSPAVAEALAPRQAALYQRATRDPGARAALAAIFTDVDVVACALSLDAPTPIADLAARTLLELLAGQRRPGHAIAPTLDLASVDRNPLRSIEDHPAKDGNALDFGTESPAAWAASITRALAAIAAALPDLHAELATTLRRIVPVGVDPEQHRSCSYREAPGLVYLSLHPGNLTMAEAIIHETQHTKLNLLSWLDPILDNPADQRVVSPVRPDLRPLFGVLLAAHAFVPVAALHHALAAIDHPIAREAGFVARRAAVLASNAAALATLRAHARPTPTGSRVVAALDSTHAALAELA